MLFDARPKIRRGDLYGRDSQYIRLGELVSQRTPLILIKGSRRSGKTSLLNTFLKNENSPYILIDSRNWHLNRNMTQDRVFEYFQDSINKFMDQNRYSMDKLRERIGRIRSVSIGGNGITFDGRNDGHVPLMAFFSELDAWAADRNEPRHVILAIDEAQRFDNVKDFDVTQLLASIYDSCHNITVMLSGSEVGLMERLVRCSLEHPNADRALAGRVKEEIVLSPFTDSESREYLRMGFEQIDDKIPQQPNFEQITDAAIGAFGGTVGWLNNFGVQFQSKKTIPDSYADEIKSVQNEGMVMVRDEFDSLLSVRDNLGSYEKFMHVLSLQPESGADFDTIMKSLKDVRPEEVRRISEDLLEYGFVSHISGSYRITDPLSRLLFKTIN